MWLAGSWSSRPAPDRSKLPPRDITKDTIDEFYWKNVLRRTIHYVLQKKCISDILRDHSLSSWHCDHSHASNNTLRNAYIWRFPFNSLARMLRFLFLPRSFPCWSSISHAHPLWPSRHGVFEKKDIKRKAQEMQKTGCVQPTFHVGLKHRKMIRRLAMRIASHPEERGTKTNKKQIGIQVSASRHEQAEELEGRRKDGRRTSTSATWRITTLS